MLTDEILRSKVKDFGKDMNIKEFSYFNGWLLRFKQRHNINIHVLCGESAGIDANLIEDGRQRARDAISKYHPCDVFNMDETGLYYRMTPDRSLTTTSYTKGITPANRRPFFYNMAHRSETSYCWRHHK